MNPTFAQKWQQISFAQAELSWCITQHMGFDFFSPRTAHEWRQLRHDYLYLLRMGDTQLANAYLEDMQKVIKRDRDNRQDYERISSRALGRVS